MVKYVVPDTPRNRLDLDKNRARFPVYEDNLPLVYETLKKLLLAGKATDGERTEFIAVEKMLGHNIALDPAVTLALLRSYNKD